MDAILPTLLTAQDVGLWLCLPTDRVIRLAREGHIPCIVLPSSEMLFDSNELAAWLEKLRPGKETAHADHYACCRQSRRER